MVQALRKQLLTKDSAMTRLQEKVKLALAVKDMALVLHLAQQCTAVLYRSIKTGLASQAVITQTKSVDLKQVAPHQEAIQNSMLKEAMLRNSRQKTLWWSLWT